MNRSNTVKFFHAVFKTICVFVAASLVCLLLICSFDKVPKTLMDNLALVSLIFLFSFWALVFTPDKVICKIPTLSLFLSTEAWLKREYVDDNADIVRPDAPDGEQPQEERVGAETRRPDPAMSRSSRGAQRKEDLYMQKVQSMNLVTSITGVMITVILFLTHELGKADAIKSYSIVSEHIYFLLRYITFFTGFSAIGLLLLTAEMLDTAGNIFVDRHESHGQQRFFYSEMFLMGGAGWYYVVYALFSLSLVSFFSFVLYPLVVLALLFAGFILFATPYFFGHYELVDREDQTHGARLDRRHAHKNPYNLGVITGGTLVIGSLFAVFLMVTPVSPLAENVTAGRDMVKIGGDVTMGDSMIWVPVAVIAVVCIVTLCLLWTDPSGQRGKNIVKLILALTQVGAIIVAGWWTYFKFIRIEAPLVAARLQKNLQGISCLSSIQIGSLQNQLTRFRVDFSVALKNIGDIDIIVDGFRIDVYKKSLPRGEGPLAHRISFDHNSPKSWSKVPPLSFEEKLRAPAGTIRPGAVAWTAETLIIDSGIDDIFAFHFRADVQGEKWPWNEAAYGPLEAAKGKDCDQVIESFITK